MEIFDTHTHLNVAPFLGKADEEIALARHMQVTRMNIVGFDSDTIAEAIRLAETYESLYATIGWHPTEAPSYTREVEANLIKHLSHPKVIAVGEIGLDYHWMTASKEQQIEVFKRQIQLAKDHQRPFVVHTREALEDTYQVLCDVGVGEAGGIIHSYSGSLEMAQKFVDLGMMISFSGVVTFKKALDVQEAAVGLPLNKILVETDAPYLAPVPKRGKENKTAYTRYVVDKIAELRGISSKEVAEATYENAMALFRLKGSHWACTEWRPLVAGVRYCLRNSFQIDERMEHKINIQEVLVVEGKCDTENLRRFYDVDTYETKGSAITDDDLERIAYLNDLCGVIVLTDPDYNGERIRKLIMQAVPTAKHAFLNRGEAVPKSKTKGRSLGVEHASFEDLQKALSGVLGSYDDDNRFDITKSDLMRLGLLMGSDSRKRREYLGEHLRMGYTNGKQLLKRLELFGVTLAEVEEVMEEYEWK